MSNPEYHRIYMRADDGDHVTAYLPLKDGQFAKTGPQPYLLKALLKSASVVSDTKIRITAPRLRSSSLSTSRGYNLRLSLELLRSRARARWSSFLDSATIGRQRVIRQSMGNQAGRLLEAALIPGTEVDAQTPRMIEGNCGGAPPSTRAPARPRR